MAVAAAGYLPTAPTPLGGRRPRARCGRSRAWDAVVGFLRAFPLPLPARCRERRKRKRATCPRHILTVIVAQALSAAGETVALDGPDDAAGRDEGCQPLVEGGGADAAEGAQLRDRERAIGIGQCGGDALVDGAGFRRW